MYYYLNALCKVLIYVLFYFYGENKNEMKNKHTNKQTNKQPSNDSVSSTRLPRNCKNTKLEKVVRFKNKPLQKLKACVRCFLSNFYFFTK